SGKCGSAADWRGAAEGDGERGRAALGDAAAKRLHRAADFAAGKTQCVGVVQRWHGPDMAGGSRAGARRSDVLHSCIEMGGRERLAAARHAASAGGCGKDETAGAGEDGRAEDAGEAKYFVFSLRSVNGRDSL